MQKKCKPNAMEFAPIAECCLSSTKIQYFFEQHDENINLFALGVLFL